MAERGLPDSKANAPFSLTRPPYLDSLKAIATPGPRATHKGPRQPPLQTQPKLDRQGWEGNTDLQKPRQEL